MRNATKKATMQIGFKMYGKKKKKRASSKQYMKDCNENYRKSLEGMEKKTMKFLNCARIRYFGRNRSDYSSTF